MKVEEIQKSEFVTTSGRVVQDTLEVEIMLDDHSEMRIEAHYRSFVRLWEKGSHQPTFTLSEFIQYISTCFYLRGRRITSSLKDYSKAANRTLVPALIGIVLENIGRVTIKELGITLSPVVNVDPALILLPSKLDEMTTLIQELEDMGIEMYLGIPKEESGGVDFMFFQCIGNLMATHNPSAHPVYALLKSFVSMSSIQSILNPRICYPDRSDYDTQYKLLLGRK